MKRKAKLLHLITTVNVGGAENHVLTLLENLSNKFDVILAFFKVSADSESLLSRFSSCGIKVADLNMKSRFDVSALGRLHRLLQEEKPDILHTHLARSDILGSFISRMTHIPHVISTVHNTEPFFRNPLISFVLRKGYSFCDKVIVISDAVGRSLVRDVKLDADMIERIHYGYKPNGKKANRDIRKELGISEGSLLIGSVGRLTKQKGHRYLLEAMALIVRDIPSVKLLIAGRDDDGLSQAYKRDIEKLGLKDSVILYGYSDDVPSVMSALDLFVLPSLWEGFGLVLLEAMYQSKAIVASNVDAIPEVVIDGETGLLVPPKKTVALADAVVTLLRDPVKRNTFGKKGSVRCQEHFAVEKMVSITENLYRQVLSTSLH